MKKIILYCLCLLFLCTGLKAQSTGEILTISANPEEGFYWGYALYLPQTLDTSKKLPVLLIMANTGQVSSVEETEKTTLFRLRHELSEYSVADELGVPLVVPIVPRLENFYTHDLSRIVLVSQEESFKRLDLQVLNMLQDARQQLKKRHIRTKNKFLVTGFSAAGVFAWRWTMLHPEYVLATVTGGALYHMLPVEKWNGETLIYPVGVGDLQELAGKKFNKEAWLKIPIFSSNGVNDDNDTFIWEECFSSKVEKPVLQHLLPGKDIFERRAQSLHLLAQLAPNVQTHIYPRLGHQPVTEDVIEFLKKHMNGGPLQPFTPTDTSSEKPPMPELPVHITAALWGDDPKIPAEHRQYLPPDILLLKGKGGRHTDWKHNEYSQIDILQRGKVIASPISIGSISDDVKTFLLFNLHLTADQIKHLRKKGRAFRVRAHYPEVVDIPADLSLSK